MLKRNQYIANIKPGYLFPEIAKRRKEFLKENPNAKIISLGVGNTTEPIPPYINNGLVEGAKKLGTIEGYSGYQDEGLAELREKINDVYYNNKFSLDEIFISDGAKCDIGRLQLLFGSGRQIAVQDPSYPVYVDGSVLTGSAGGIIQKAGGAGFAYEGIIYLPCTMENNFFPDLSKIPENSLVYICYPNNPTGAAANKEQLNSLVGTAIKKSCIIIFDSAYNEFIRDPSIPRSIFEIDGAKKCAIEVNSFSKSAGFTGVRLGWTAVSKELAYSTGESILSDWSRINATVFNGASNIAQAGGIAALDIEGQEEIRQLTDFYLGNAKLILDVLHKKGISCTGGDNSPYIWAHFPAKGSWEIFSEILEKCQVVVTPGAGFGPAGENYIRFSAFARRADTEEACSRLEKYL